MQKTIVSDLQHQDHLHFNNIDIWSFSSQSIEVHIYDEQSLQNYYSKISFLLTNNIVLYIKKELQSLFDDVVAQIKENYPFLFFPEYKINYI